MSQSQQIAALNTANRVRLKRTQDRRDIAALDVPEGLAVCADILESLPDHWRTATPLWLLTSVHRVGRFYALALMRKAEISEQRRLGELTERQRLVLGSVLRATDGKRVAA